MPKTDSALLWPAFATLCVSGIALLFSGFLENRLVSVVVFEDVPALFALLPVILGLKCAILMNFTARLITAHRIGKLSTSKLSELESLFSSNFGVVLVQAYVGGMIIPLASKVIGSLFGNTPFKLSHVLLTTATCMVSSTVCVFLLACFAAVCVYLTTRVLEYDPAVVIPIVASVGDPLMVLVSSGVASVLYYLSPAALLLLVAATTAAVIGGSIGTGVRHSALRGAWGALGANVVLEVLSGLLVQHAVEDGLVTMTVFSPLLAGTGGNIAAIYHTYLAFSTSPHAGLAGSGSSSSSSSGELSTVRRTLWVVGLPVHVFFLLVGDYVFDSTHSRNFVTLGFGMLYVATAAVQVRLLLAVADWLAALCRRHHVDPDDWLLPVLSGLSDLFGNAVLMLLLHSGKMHHYSQHAVWGG